MSISDTMQTTFSTGADNVNQNRSVQIEVSCETEPGNEVQGSVMHNYSSPYSKLEVYVKFHCFNETHHVVNILFYLIRHIHT